MIENINIHKTGYLTPSERKEVSTRLIELGKIKKHNEIYAYARELGFVMVDRVVNNNGKTERRTYIARAEKDPTGMVLDTMIDLTKEGEE